LRVKQDAVPGMTVPVWFEAVETGKGEIACAQLCGLGHYRMKGFYTVESPQEFAAWMAEQAEAGSFEDDYY
jgi:cytochrome c oxidase subunit 2